MSILETVYEKARAGRIDEISPVFKALLDVRENDGFHDNDPVLYHITRVVRAVIKIAGSDPDVNKFFEEKIGSFTRGTLLAVAGVFHDVAKGCVIKSSQGITTCPGHEEASAVMAESFLRENGAGEEETAYITDVIRAHGLPHRCLKIGNSEIDRCFAVLEADTGKIYPDILVFTRADVAGSQLEVKNRLLYDFINGIIDRKIAEYFEHRRIGSR